MDAIEDEHACFRLSYACDDPESVEIRVDTDLVMQWHRSSELEDGGAAAETLAPNTYCHHTHSLDEGSHNFSLTAVCDGSAATHSRSETTSPPDFRIARLEADQPSYAKGDTIVLELDAGADGMTVAAHFGTVDFEYTSGDEQVTPLGGGRYEISYTIDSNNDKRIGDYVVPVQVSNGTTSKHWFLPVRYLPAGYPRVSLTTGQFFADTLPPRPAAPSGTEVLGLTLGTIVPPDSDDPAMFDEAPADIEGTYPMTVEFTAPWGLEQGDFVDIEMEDPDRDGYFASKLRVSDVDCDPTQQAFCNYTGTGFLQEEPNGIAPGGPVGQVRLRVVMADGAASPMSLPQDVFACAGCPTLVTYVEGTINYIFDQCRADESVWLQNSPQVHPSTCTLVNRPARRIMVEVVALGTLQGEVLARGRSFVSPDGGFKVQLPGTAAELQHELRVWSVTPKDPGERIAVGAWIGGSVTKVPHMTANPVDYQVHSATLASFTPLNDASPAQYGYHMNLWTRTIDLEDETQADMAWATHIIDETKRGIDYYDRSPFVDKKKMHWLNISWQPYDIGLDSDEKANQNNTAVHPSFILFLPESTDAFIINHELAHYIHRRYMRPTSGYGRFDEPMAHANAGMVMQMGSPWPVTAGVWAGSWMAAGTNSYKGAKETIDYNAHFKFDSNGAFVGHEESNLQFFPDNASYADCNNRPGCCGAKYESLCVLGSYGYLQRIFWDLHDPTTLEPWSPDGVAAEFDLVDGGMSSSDPKNHKLLDVLFGYLGGNQATQNSSYSDRGMTNVDHVDLLDGMMCRNHMTQAQAQVLLRDVMNYDYDFGPNNPSCL